VWADNETTTDLLGFAVHARLLRQLVTREELLPVTIGVFGDWGSGKSSVMWMLREELSAEEDVLCLYFDGWTLEGYDDAKAALMSSILMQLGEHKRFGPKIRLKIAALLKLVNYMRVISLGLKIGAGALIGLALGAGHIDPQTAGAVGAGVAHVAGSLDRAHGEDADYVDWQKLIEQDESQPGPLDVRAFQERFKEALEESGVRSLVVLIDNLDRCAPDRLVENLEAIKLFLAVPKTAFVIAADEWIVRHAISTRYGTGAARDEQAAREAPRDLATDYLEKLVQVPYHLPRLSPSEIETYVTLLFCRLHLDDDQFDEICAHCEAERQANFYVTYGAGFVREALGSGVPEALAEQLQWTGGIAPRLAEGLKGNPRQVKRFLNALLLRKQLGEIANLGLKDEVLVKLMLLEYTHFALFNELYGWQARAEGKPQQLAALEQAARNGAVEGEARPDAPPDDAADASQEWLATSAQAWLRLDPPLADGAVDLRDYFWVARDRLQGTVAGLSMLSPFVRTTFEQLVSDNAGERQLGAGKVGELRADDRASLLGLLGMQVRQRPQETGAVEGLLALMEAGIDGSGEMLIEALSDVPSTLVEPSAAYTLQTVVQLQPALAARVVPLVQTWAETKTRVGRAAQSVLRAMRSMGEKR
jgi:hypothetical protein